MDKDRSAARVGEIVLYRQSGCELPALVTVTARSAGPAQACATARPEGSGVSLIVFEPCGHMFAVHAVPWWRSPGEHARSWRHCDGPDAAGAARMAAPDSAGPEML